MHIPHCHLAQLPHKYTATYGNETIFTTCHFSTNERISISWKQFSNDIIQLAVAMSFNGIDVGDKIGLYSQNTYYYFVVEFAAYLIRATIVPIYATASANQVKYIAKDAQLKLLFLGEQLQYENAYTAFSNNILNIKLITFDNSIIFKNNDVITKEYSNFLIDYHSNDKVYLVEEWCKACSNEDLACIIYTSGTTGHPKGAMLSHNCLNQALCILDTSVKDIVSEKDTCLNFLPLAHIFEKIASYYCLFKHITIAINHDPKMILHTLQEVRPSIMCSVPHFWEKIYNGIYNQVNTSSIFSRLFFRYAIKTGKRYYLDHINVEKKVPQILKLKISIYEKYLFSKIRSTIGIENGILFPTAGALLSNPINEFLQAIGIPIFIGYGLTETTATVSIYPIHNFKIGSIGNIVNGIEVKIGDNNEILVKGKNVMLGYYNKPKDTKKAFTSDGFFKTGDAGKIENGTLYITERIKDLYKTSNGKYIAPQTIENRLTQDRFIDRAIIIADKRRYVTALIVPDYELIRNYAYKHHFIYNSLAELLSSKLIQDLYNQRLTKIQRNVAPFEHVIKFHLLTEPFTMDTGELTNTLKIKRKFVFEKYCDVIDNMYKR